MRKECTMQVKVRFKIGELAEEIQRDVKLGFGSAGTGVKIEGVHYKIEEKYNAIYCLYDNPTLSDMEQVEKSLWLEQGMKPEYVISEDACLDGNAIAPVRGIYSTANARAVVDSHYLDGFMVFRIEVRSTKLRSAWDLYHEIRKGNAKPTEPWDKPAEVKSE